MDERRGCPFCKEQVEILITDGEGNLRGDDYLDNPVSGMGFVLHHPNYNNDCPLACHEDEPLGIMRYDTPGEAYTAWNTRVYDAEIERLQEENLGLALRLNEALKAQKAFEDALERGWLVQAPPHKCTDSTVSLKREIYGWGGYGGSESLGIYKCNCGKVWKIRHQCDDGTGDDDIWIAPGEESRGYKFTREEAEAALEKEANDVLPR